MTIWFGNSGSYPTEFGYAGVALAAQAAKFETAVDVLNRMTDWLVNHFRELTGQ